MKFKVGDLVTLSAAGKKAKQNNVVVGGFGMVIKVTGRPWPIQCQWFGSNRETWDFKPYELKFFKEGK